MSNTNNIGTDKGSTNQLQITRHKDSSSDIKPFSAQVNPSSYQISHNISFNEDQGMQGTDAIYSLNKVSPQVLNLELFLDATGSLNQHYKYDNLIDQVNHLMEVSFIEFGAKGKTPAKLEIIWGQMEFIGVLTNISINYTKFDSTGLPLRAEASCIFSGGRRQKATNHNNTEVAEADTKNQIEESISNEKHGINAIEKEQSYVAAIVALQVKSITSIPKSLRVAEELTKLIEQSDLGAIATLQAKDITSIPKSLGVPEGLTKLINV